MVGHQSIRAPPRIHQKGEETAGVLKGGKMPCVLLLAISGSEFGPSVVAFGAPGVRLESLVRCRRLLWGEVDSRRHPENN